LGLCRRITTRLQFGSALLVARKRPYFFIVQPGESALPFFSADPAALARDGGKSLEMLVAFAA
jgi:hypothetical protein